MTKRVQRRRGTTAQHSTFIGAAGEVTVDSTKNVQVVHDGLTPGGIPNAARANDDQSIDLIRKDAAVPVKVTNSGNLLVGASTESPNVRLQVVGANSGDVYASMGTHNTSPNRNLKFSSFTISGAQHVGHQINAPGSGADDGVLSFATNGAERSRINPVGFTKFSNTGLYGNVAGAGNLISTNNYVLQSSLNASTVISLNSSDGAAVNSYASFLPTGSLGNHYQGRVNGVTTFQVLANGNVQNTNNSYGAISDAKLKIVVGSAPSYWEKFKLIEWVKYTLKNDPTNQEMLGVIAQQAREIMPGLIEETPDMVDVVKTREVTKEVPVTVTEIHEVSRTEIKLIDGKYTQVTTIESQEVQAQVYDEFPVYDESGEVVMQLVSPAFAAKDAILDKDGNEVEPAVPAQEAVYEPLIHKVPRVETVTETEEYTEKEPNGEVTLSVKYSILGHVADVVLQEAMARIEALEAN